MKLTWLGHSSVKIEANGKIVYIDPYAGSEDDYTPADIVLISRWHFDHCNMTKVRKASNDLTHVVGTGEVAGELYPCSVLRVGEKKVFGGVEVLGMPAVRRAVPHRGHEHEEPEKVGFFITIKDKTAFYLADSGYLEEFHDLKPDVLLIAVGGTYTNTAREAASAANFIAPKIAIPIHWGSVEGTRDDAELFAELTEVPVKILEPGGSVEV